MYSFGPGFVILDNSKYPKFGAAQNGLTEPLNTALLFCTSCVCVNPVIVSTKHSPITWLYIVPKLGINKVLYCWSDLNFGEFCVSNAVKKLLNFNTWFGVELYPSCVDIWAFGIAPTTNPWLIAVCISVFVYPVNNSWPVTKK